MAKPSQVIIILLLLLAVILTQGQREYISARGENTLVALSQISFTYSGI